VCTAELLQRGEVARVLERLVQMAGTWRSCAGAGVRRTRGDGGGHFDTCRGVTVMPYGVSPNSAAASRAA
jgi:hypothetical protein